MVTPAGVGGMPGNPGDAARLPHTPGSRRRGTLSGIGLPLPKSFFRFTAPKPELASFQEGSVPPAHDFHVLARAVPERATRHGRSPTHSKPLRPVVHYSGKLMGLPLLRCGLWWERIEGGARRCWHYRQYSGDLKRLPTQVQKDVEYFKKDVRFHLSASSRKAHGSASTSR